MKKSFLALCLLSIAAPMTGYSAGTHSRPTSTTHEVTLVPGLGNLHHPVTTTSAEAQRFFDQGLTYVFAFHHSQAIRSFEKAAELDPNMAMAWWGVALALGPNYNVPMDDASALKAYEALQKAQGLADHVSEPERDAIAALAARYAPDPAHADRAQLDRAYADAMRALSKKYPDSLDYATLFAESLMDLRPWKLWLRSGEPAEGTPELVATLESVLARNPNHMGANHYYIHAMEASPTPERALDAANRLTGLAPAAGHLVHMPAHIYMRVGDYNRAADSNVNGARADEAFASSQGSGGLYLGLYYSHNLHFLAAASSMAGRWNDAWTASMKLEHHLRPMLQEMPAMEFMSSTAMQMAIRFRKWDEALRIPEPSTDLATAHALWLWGQAVAHAGKGELNAARAIRISFENERSGISSDMVYGNNYASPVLAVASQSLAGEIARRSGNLKAAIAAYTTAARFQDELAYNEPEDWFYPVRETLGGLLLQRQNPVAAEKVFRADLADHRLNPRSLYGLAASLHAQGRHKEAVQVMQQFKKAWERADTEVSIAGL